MFSRLSRSAGNRVRSLTGPTKGLVLVPQGAVRLLFFAARFRNFNVDACFIGCNLNSLSGNSQLHQVAVYLHSPFGLWPGGGKV